MQRLMTVPLAFLKEINTFGEGSNQFTGTALAYLLQGKHISEQRNGKQYTNQPTFVIFISSNPNSNTVEVVTTSKAADLQRLSNQTYYYTNDVMALRDAIKALLENYEPVGTGLEKEDIVLPTQYDEMDLETKEVVLDEMNLEAEVEEFDSEYSEQDEALVQASVDITNESSAQSDTQEQSSEPDVVEPIMSELSEADLAAIDELPAGFEIVFEEEAESDELSIDNSEAANEVKAATNESNSDNATSEETDLSADDVVDEQNTEESVDSEMDADDVDEIEELEAEENDFDLDDEFSAEDSSAMDDEAIEAAHEEVASESLTTSDFKEWVKEVTEPKVSSSRYSSFASNSGNASSAVDVSQAAEAANFSHVFVK